MKNSFALLIALVVPFISINGEGKRDKIDDQFYEQIETIKMDYRSKLAELLEDSTKIEVLQLNLEKYRKHDGNPFKSPSEGYYRIRDFEFEIKQKKTFESEDMIPWRTALQGLLVPDHAGSYLSFHSHDTVIIVYAENAISALEESSLLTITLSWKNNNYLLSHPRLGKEKHLIAGKEIKKLMKNTFPDGDFEAKPTLKTFATGSN
ncbi:MAG: hypothetical protein AAF558_15115 [Verrucomicrobiota bacterium]